MMICNDAAKGRDLTAHLNILGVNDVKALIHCIVYVEVVCNLDQPRVLLFQGFHASAVRPM